MVSGLFRMVRLTLAYRRRFAWFMVFSLGFSLISGSFALIMKSVFWTLEKNHVPDWMAQYLGTTSARHGFFNLLILSAVLMLIKCSCQYLRRYLEAWLTQQVIMDMQNTLAQHLLSLDLGFFQKERAGELLSRLTNDLMFLGRSIKFTCILITRPITLLAFLCSCFYINYKLALLGLVAVPIGAGAITVLSRKMRRAAKKAQEKRADLTNAMVQFIMGMRTVKAFTCEDFESRQFREENRHLFNVTMKRERARSKVRPVNEFVAVVGTLIVLAVAGEWVFNKGMFLADLAGFMTALALSYQPAKELSRANSDLAEALPATERVFSLLNLTADIREGSKQLTPTQHSIKLEDVSFSYDGDSQVLTDINLEIEAEKCLAIVGPSGAGKSTIADLIIRFYDPTAGTITLDGTDIRDITFASLRENIALVSQDSFLFNSNIKNNIAYGRSDAEMDDIIAAAKAANIHDDIMEMPEKYETLVGERGSSLSGGQRQRVSIARAIFKNAPILILDEATSSLDSANERQVQEALDRLMSGRTSIVIAHRLSTIRHADQIVVLEDGCITGRGTHEELLTTNERYAQLVHLQHG